MILYTPVSMESIFANSTESALEMKVFQYKGRTMMGYASSDGRYQISRLISTCPQDYLDERFQPNRYVSPDE